MDNIKKTQKYIIYMHTSPSNKKYIGITKQEPILRWGKNGERYKRCTSFWRAINKYGWENITHEIIDTAETLEEANQKEQFYISKYETHDSRHGYNCTNGGEGVEGWRATDLQKKKNSEAKKAMWKDPTIRDQLTKERQKRGRSIIERERLSKISSLNWQNEAYATQLIEHLRIIAQDPVCKEKRVNAMKNKWKNDEEFQQKMSAHLDKIHNDDKIRKKHSEDMKKLWNENREVFLKNRKYLSGADNPTSRAVRCVELNMVFETARAAEAYTGVSYKNISNVVRGKNKTAGGYHWEYADS